MEGEHFTLHIVYGINSARMRQIKTGCEAGTLDVYKNFRCNYVTDVMEYEAFVLQLLKRFGREYPMFHYVDGTGTMAVLSRREDIPHRLKWNVKNVIEYLCG